MLKLNKLVRRVLRHNVEPLIVNQQTHRLATHLRSLNHFPHNGFESPELGHGLFALARCISYLLFERHSLSFFNKLLQIYIEMNINTHVIKLMQINT